MSGAVVCLALAALFAAIAVVTYFLAELHPDPSRTLHIPVGVCSAAGAVIFFLLTFLFIIFGA